MKTTVFAALGFLVTMGSAPLTATADAAVALIELRPGELTAAPMSFEIHSVRLADGQTQFTITVAEKGKWTFDSRPHPRLSIVEEGSGSSRVSPVRDADGLEPRMNIERQGNAIICNFSISAKELADPNFCFDFRVMSEHLASGTIFYARLKNFAPP